MQTVDRALAKVGGYKRWHLAIFFGLGMSSFMGLCWQQLIIVFQGMYLNSKLKNKQQAVSHIFL